MQSLPILNLNVVFVSILIVIVYLCTLFLVERQMRMNFRKIISFILGLVLINVCFGDRLNFYGHLLFSVHMFQMSLLFFFIPLLILFGLPDLNRGYHARLAVKMRRGKIFHNVILILFSFAFSLYHLPVVFNTVMSYKLFHDFSQVVLLALSILVWWPVSVGFDPKMPQKVRRIYISKMILLLMPACLFLIIPNKELYRIYNDLTFLSETLQICFSPNMDARDYFLKYNFLSTVEEQRLGGIIMLISHKLTTFVLLRNPKG